MSKRKNENGALFRHSKLEMTGWYMKQIPETVRAVVEKMDADIC
jgi:hypothetical protein